MRRVSSNTANIPGTNVSSDNFGFLRKGVNMFGKGLLWLLRCSLRWSGGLGGLYCQPWPEIAPEIGHVANYLRLGLQERSHRMSLKSG